MRPNFNLNINPLCTTLTPKRVITIRFKIKSLKLHNRYYPIQRTSYVLSFFPSEFKADDHALKQNSVVKAQTCQVLLYTAYLYLPTYLISTIISQIRSISC